MEELDHWFLENKRSFPWRVDPTPYRVWVSEVMLQQTRAQVVVAYFERWMNLFPDVITLAQAPLDQVIKAWEGLGYYSRARNLHRGAAQILRDFEGRIPSKKEELLKISGLGPYTVAAILSFGFHQRAAPVDGNVLRVASRFFWVEEDIGKASVKEKIGQMAEGLLDLKRPWVSAEALIELGATICQPKPRCSECPLQSKCKAALQRQPDALPIKTGGEKTELLTRGVALVEAQGAVLVRKNGPRQVMADLYEFPYFEGARSAREVQKSIEMATARKVQFVDKLCRVVHTFTKYRATLTAYRFLLEEKVIVEGYCWVPLDELENLPFSSGHKKILKMRLS